IEETAQSTPYPRKPATPPARRGAKPAPATLMGEVVGPKAPATGSSSKREAFRAFMLSRHLRATEWAKKANVPAALIYSYLTGRSASIPPDVLAALAKVAKVKPDDMFKI
ncbi:MAG: helix-turn-helix transcriptional regulator, partial [Rhizomicrobium sp.]